MTTDTLKEEPYFGEWKDTSLRKQVESIMLSFEGLELPGNRSDQIAFMKVLKEIEQTNNNDVKSELLAPRGKTISARGEDIRIKIEEIRHRISQHTTGEV